MKIRPLRTELLQTGGHTLRS